MPKLIQQSLTVNYLVCFPRLRLLIEIRNMSYGEINYVCVNLFGFMI